MDDLRRRFEALKNELREVRRASKDTGEEMESAFSKGTSGAEGFTVAMGTVAAAVTAAAEGFKELSKAREAAASAVTDAAGQLGTLAQLGGGDQGKVGALQLNALEFSNQTGLSMGAAAKAVFDLESAGSNNAETRDFYARLSFVEENIAPMIQGAAMLRANLGPQVGTDQQLVSKAIAAATFVPGATPSDVLEASSKGGFFAKELGLSDEELIAATSIVGQKTDINAAGTQTSAFLKFLNSKSFGQSMKGQGLAAMIESIQNLGLEGEALNKYFGEVDAMRGFGALAGSDLAGRTAAIEAANATDLGGAAADSYLATPLGASARAARVTKQRASNADIQRGMERNLANSVLESAKTRVRSGEDPLGNIFSPEWDNYLLFEAAVPDFVPLLGGMPLNPTAVRRTAGGLMGETDADFARRWLPYTRAADKPALESAVRSVGDSPFPTQAAPIYNTTNNVTNVYNYGGPEDSSGGVN
ncbi:hypothetical protein GC173_17165 [bacterium]|nr:hypothetical protein [bacterium]